MYLKSYSEFRVKTNIYRKFIQFSSKQRCFLHALPTWVHGRGLRHLQPPSPLPAANDELVKVLDLLFFCLFHLEMRKNFGKTAFFHFWTKAMLLLNTFSPGILWKTSIKKPKKTPETLNGCISKARANSESKLTFSESSFNFLQNSVVFYTLYPRGYTVGGSSTYNPRCRCQRLAVLKELR